MLTHDSFHVAYKEALSFSHGRDIKELKRSTMEFLEIMKVIIERGQLTSSVNLSVPLPVRMFEWPASLAKSASIDELIMVIV